MNIATIEGLIAEIIEEKKQQYGAASQLTPAGIDDVTDSVADVLSSVNPVHSYPSTLKP